MSTRTLAAIVVATLTLGTTILAGGPASADATQLAKRDEFAQRTRLAASVTYGPYHLVNRHSNKCLTILDVSTANNANAVQYDCDSNYPYNEDWWIEFDLDGWFPGSHLRNGHSNKCLTIFNISTDNEANAVQYDCDSFGPYNESWFRDQASVGVGDRWHFRNVNSTKCLTILGASKANNARAVQYTCDYTGPYNEEWYLVPVSH